MELSRNMMGHGPTKKKGPGGILTVTLCYPTLADAPVRAGRFRSSYVHEVIKQADFINKTHIIRHALLASWVSLVCAPIPYE